MAESSPVFSLHLQGTIVFRIGFKGLAGTIPDLVIRTNDSSSTTTLVIPGYNSTTKSFSLPLAVQTGLLDLFDMESDTNVPVPYRHKEPEELIIKSGAQNHWFNMVIDEQDELWKQILTPGHRYEVRWQEGPNAPWAYRGEKPQDTFQRLIVHRSSTTIKLSVLDATSTPPKFSLSLSPTAPLCHLNGEPPFGFTLQITSHADTILTICLNKTPLKEPHSFDEIAHTLDEHGEEVEWPYSIGCWGEEQPFPNDFCFEEFVPGVPYVQTFWLEEYDKKTANGGELETLDAGRVYLVSVGRELVGSFGTWMTGRKEEVLAGSEREKEERWRGSRGLILLDVSEPFTFETV
jgi:hypothetical protein